MKMTKITHKCETNPYLTMYHNVAFPLSIIQGNANVDITPWICGRYINCRYDENSKNNQFNVCIDDEWGIMEGALTVQSVSVSQELIKHLSLNYIDFLKSMIDQKSYPQGEYNEEYIPGKWAYKNTQYKHDFLLIGYNEIEKIFYSIGYLKDNNYCKYDIPYANMEKSLKSLVNDNLNFLFFNFNENFDFSLLNVSKIHNELFEYVNSFTTHLKNCNKQYFGLNAIKKLKEHIVKESNNERIDFRFTKGFFEHKKIMNLRAEYLCRVGLISSDTVCASKAVLRKSELVHLLALKYIITKDGTLINRICDYIEDTIAMEAVYLPALIDSLKKALLEEKNEQ